MNIKILLNIFITLVLIYYLLIKLNFITIYSTFAGMNLFWLVSSIPFIVIMYLVKTIKWNILLNCINIKIPFFEALKLILIGTFYGTFTPGRSGELARSFYLKKAEKSKTIPTIIIDRIVDVIFLLSMSVLSIVLFFNDTNLFILTILMFIIFIIGAIIITNKKIISFIFKILKKEGDKKENYLRSINMIIKNRKVILSVFALSLLYYAINLLVFWIVLKSLNPALNDIIIFSLPIIVIMGNFPISISGLGVREFVSVIIFTKLNESPAYGFSFSLILYILTSLMPGLIGSIFIIKNK